MSRGKFFFANSEVWGKYQCFRDNRSNLVEASS